jgi:hypothetical protein
MEFNFGTFVAAGLRLVSALASEPTPNTDKFVELENAVALGLEAIDDLVSFLPWGFGAAIRAAVDNPYVDGLQRQLVAQPVAEHLVRVYKDLHKVGGAEAVAKYITLQGAPAMLPRLV